MMAALGPRVRRLSALHSHLRCGDTDVEPAANAGAPRFVPQSEDRTNQVMRINHIARALPKTELHLHLDGSLPFEFIAKRAKARGIECPATPQGLREMVDKMKAARTAQAASADAREITKVGVGKNWAIFDYMNMFLQTADELEEATCLLATSLKTRQNVRSVAAAVLGSAGRPVAVPPTRAAPLLRARCGWRRSASARRCTRSKA